MKSRKQNTVVTLSDSFRKSCHSAKFILTRSTDRAPTGLVSLQTINSRCWRTWPLNASSNWVDMLQVSSVFSSVRVMWTSLQFAVRSVGRGSGDGGRWSAMSCVMCVRNGVVLSIIFMRRLARKAAVATAHLATVERSPIIVWTAVTAATLHRPRDEYEM